MASYAIDYRPAAAHELADLRPRLRRRIARAVDRLSADPRPPHALVMWGDWEGFRRIRVARYRVMYVVDDPRARVVVARIRIRSDQTYADPPSPYDIC